nr:hypothetical protein BaRGS_011654 [Batillaria attramentaria]
MHQAQSEIGALQMSGGSATAGQAIRTAYREGFSTANGARAGVPHIIVHVSNGPAADPTFLEQEVTTVIRWLVNAAKQQGIAVYNVGIGAGGNIAPDRYSAIASEPSSRYVLRADNYQTLNTLSAPLAGRVADACLNQADVVFMLDGSGSVGSANFQHLINYVKTFSSQLPVSQNGVHIGVQQFSNRPTTEFGLSMYTDSWHIFYPHNRASLLRGIDNIQYMGGGTNTDTALNAMRTQMFSQQMGARPGVPRVAVVITDGRSSNMASTIKEADAARQQNIGVVAVGVGSQVNDAELEGIADSSRDVFHVNSYSDLPGVTQRVMQAACQANVNDPCQDVLPNCAQYESNMCTQYAGWAKDNCARHCKICTPIQPAILPTCQDKAADCGDYDISVCQDPQYKTLGHRELRPLLWAVR